MSRLSSIVLLFAATFATAQSDRTAAVKKVQEDLDYLAGPECEGRGLQTKGLVKAGAYIAKAFEASGLKPAFEKSYFQEFGVPAPSELGTPISVAFKHGDGSLDLTTGTDFVATTASANGKKKLGLVFVGYGITSEQNPKYDDYAGLNVEGKVVVVIRRTPKASDPKGPFAAAQNAVAPLIAKLNNAVFHKAAGVVFVSDAATAGKTDPLFGKDQSNGLQSMDGPVIHAKRDAIDALLKKAKKPSLAEIEKSIDDDLKPQSFAFEGWEIESDIAVVKKSWPTRNVVGVLEGQGPLKDETVVIGAHYDHLGSGEQGSFPDNKGKTHFGADDNGSGTAGLLELARRYGAMKDRKGRRLVFVAFSGEEAGLFGSLHYVKNPAFPNEKTAFMLNMDMIGRMSPMQFKLTDGQTVQKDRFVVYGTGTSTGLEKFVDNLGAKLDLKILKVPGGQGPSDHTSFYNKGIPVLFFFTGTHKDYHKPSDTPDRINVPGLLKSVDFVQSCAEYYTTVKDKPDYLKTDGGSEDPTNPDQQLSRVNIPRIGFMPGDYSEAEAGVLVGGVSKGGPAEKAGIKEDDLIVEVLGKPVKNMTGYMAAMQTAKPGEEIEIVVKRQGKKVAVKVVPIK